MTASDRQVSMVEGAAAGRSPYTNQAIINACNRAAAELGLSNRWELLERAGLRLADLIQDRNAPYAGPPVDQLPNLSDAEKAAIRRQLDGVAAGGAPPVESGGGPTPRPAFLRLDPSLTAIALAPSEAERIDLSAVASNSGRRVARAWNRYGGLLRVLADRLGIDPVVAAAVLAVESSGNAFAGDGRMVIRFEVHIFHDLWGRQQPERFAQHFSFNAAERTRDHQWRPDPEQPWRPVHLSLSLDENQRSEWEVFTFASSLDATAARLSISMGAPQIMGFNYASIGYESVHAMFDAFSASEHAQIIGFFDFVQARPRAITSLQAGDLVSFAAIYNGRAHAEAYADLIGDAIAALRALLPGAALAGLAAGLPEGAREQAAAPAPFGPQPWDPQLLEAWRSLVREELARERARFQEALDHCLGPQRAALWVHWSLLAFSLAAFGVAALLTLWTRSWGIALVFGGLTAVALIAFVLTRPARSLEESLAFIAWLNMATGSFWARLAASSDPRELGQAFREAADEIARIVEKRAGLRR